MQNLSHNRILLVNFQEVSLHHTTSLTDDSMPGFPDWAIRVLLQRSLTIVCVSAPLTFPPYLFVNGLGNPARCAHV